jgi:hypothetical protein
MVTINDTAEGVLTYYIGTRPVLFGDNTKDWINTYTGKVGVYSNWSLMSTHPMALKLMPDKNYVLGSLKSSGLGRPLILEYIYSGKPHIAPLARKGGAGSGPRVTGARFKPLEYKGIAGMAAFPAGYGHAPNRNLYYSEYNNYLFDGVPAADAFLNTGHAIRYNRTYGGAFKPYVWQGTGVAAVANPGSPVPVGYNNPYGKNHVQEWRGVPSARAL